MEKIHDFYDLEVWKKAHDLVIEIYRVAKVFPEDEKYGLTSQIRRATASITSNIAEGFGRFHFNDKINFYYHARGSVSEVQNLLLIARDLKILDNNKTERLLRELDDVNMMINGLIRSIERQK